MVSDVLKYLLEGLEQALEVERELGVRTLEVDRTLLADADAVPVPSAPVPSAPKPSAPSPAVEVVFLHDKPLSPPAVEMMAKIVSALQLEVSRAPVVIAPPVPNAKIFVFLGGAALRKYMPDLKLAENMWGKSPKGKDILLVRSPEDIVRFPTVTPALKKIKEDLWRALKTIRQRLAAGRQ